MTCNYFKKNTGTVLGGTILEQMSPEVFVGHQTPPKYINREVIYTNPRHLAETHVNITEVRRTVTPELFAFEKQLDRETTLYSRLSQGHIK